MKYLNKCMMITVFAVAMNACNRDEIFEREQYKHVIALVSEGSFNIFAEEHDLSLCDAEGFTEGYVAASCGGTKPTEQVVTISLKEDAELLNEYNSISFSTEGYRYAHYLPASRYRIDQHVISIPQGGISGRMKIRVNADGLSPDSLYFIPFRVDQCSSYELNPNKTTALYRIYPKNFWASTKSIPVYTHRGMKTKEGETSPVVTMMAKEMYPMSVNEVRIVAGNKIINDLTVEVIEQWAIRLSIASNGKITIKPYSNSVYGMKVDQIDGDPDYPNVFRLVDDGYGKTFKVFLLCYDYTDADDNKTYRMKEELRIEYIKDVK